MKKRHGMSQTRLYNVWDRMRARCENPKNGSFRRYGAVGIKVCAEWQHFTHFAEWALENGYRNDLTLDRIDSCGNYEPSNCRWATYTQQNANKRPSVVGKTSAFRGVFRRQNDKRWRVRVGRGHESSYSHELAAALAYDQLAREKFGEFATLNFPERFTSRNSK